MRRLLSAVSLSALLTFPALASDTTDTATPAWLRSSVPPELLANYSVGVIGLRPVMSSGFTGRGGTIAVIDDYFDVNHPFLSGRIIGVNQSPIVFSPSPEYDGRLLDELFSPESILADPNIPIEFGHGTHVAGIASSVAPGASLVLADFLRDPEASFRWATRFRPIVYNNSWGTDVDVNRVIELLPGMNRFEALAVGAPDRTAAQWASLVDAMLEAQKTGVLVFAASNYPDLLPDDIDISAGLPLVIPELRDAWISVVNIAPDGSVVSVQCGSAADFCLAAPGGDPFGWPEDQINSTVPGGGFAAKAGTSMASPQVSGAVALAHEIFPLATPSELSQLIFQTATDVGARGIDPVHGWGVLNVGNIVGTISPRTAGTFANASWSRFSALGHTGSVMRQRLALPAPSGARNASGAPQSSYASLNTSSNGGALGLSNPILAGIWAAPLYGQATINAGPMSRSARSETAGILIGADLVSDAKSRFGIAGGYSQTRLSTRGSADSGKANAVHVGLYGSFNSDGWFAQGSGQVAFFDQSLTRHEISGAEGTSRIPVGRSSFRGTAFEADARSGYDFELGGGATLSPYATFNARWQQANSFREAGAGIFSLNGSSIS